MQKLINRVVLVLRSSPKEAFTHKGGGSYSFSDVELIAYHLHKQCSDVEVICLWDKITQPFDLVNVKVIPMQTHWSKWWAKMNIFSPEMEQYRPFLFIDLDTLVVGNLTGILPPAEEHINKFIALGPFTEDKKVHSINSVEATLYSGIMWIPANNEKITQIWEKWLTDPEEWMNSCKSGDQEFIKTTVKRPDVWWQQITNKVGTFKPKEGERIAGQDGKQRWFEYIRREPDHFSIICLHGLPKMWSAAQYRNWVCDYINECFPKQKALVTVIIPYKENPKRTWLQDAINSVPKNCQLLVSEGPGMWAENFNKVLDQAEGEYIKYLHDDDMLTPNCIEDSVSTLESTGADFIHGMASELKVKDNSICLYKPIVKDGSLSDLLKANFIHSATTMYRKSVFEKVGSFDETLPDSEEYEFNLRCLHAGLKLAYCDSVLAVYRRHDEQQSFKLNSQLQATSNKIANKYRVWHQKHHIVQFL